LTDIDRPIEKLDAKHIDELEPRESTGSGLRKDVKKVIDLWAATTVVIAIIGS